ncbi:L-2,4-diaminobutyric acid acetyltransferase [Polystyrenella longa]|uniref:L-2,4-diaminobutyric acid acetyltransferase n=1 Tax=Polystyrenella longa TaxID=2528007 RepID=A0A518CMY6_9PLAN|nr:diaminobutyrate acetyltransferase [Polystyrenella longa]QDU80596.1 L-2,4-diaminobutyric acid acetyltransferase [Polystyrenella longa]
MNESDNQKLTLRQPTTMDAGWMWRLVRETGVLDSNSCYLYLLLCRDFSESCIVAEDGSRIVGFISGYRPPETPNTLFIWQVGVSQSARRRGIALRMLISLVDRCRQQQGLEYVEATVTADNQASRRLFEKYANANRLDINEETGFVESEFVFGGHDAEPRLRIGPLNTTELRISELAP